MFVCPTIIIMIRFSERTGVVMEYMSCPEAAKKWGISERRVQILCREKRIQGVSKLGYMWLIPKDAEKPIDGRTKQGKELYHE
ncbi:Putative conjugative transposon protein Tn1549-like, CTn4-Orf25 [Clostridioides difficile E28]|nr:Putative conjugative transposon protein Tn1549-like, CTn4-Orf25 [Clostridioides difficile E28]